MAAIREFGFKVFSYELFTKGTVKETLSTINQPVIGGLPFTRATSSARMTTA